MSDGHLTRHEPVRYRVAVVVSHPIQHFAPFYRALSREPGIDLKVFFSSRMGLDQYLDCGFGREIRWDSDLLGGYPSEFLPGAEKTGRPRSWSVNSQSVVSRLSDFRPHAVLVYGYAPLISLRTIARCRRTRTAVLMMSDSELRQPRAWWKRAGKQLALRALFRHVSGFLTIGDSNEAYLRNYGVPAEKLFRSPYPTDEEAFLAAREDRAPLRREVRLRLGIPEEAFVVVFVGKLIPRKRPGDVLSAVERVARDAKPAVKVVALLVGDGELRGELEERARRNGEGLCRLVGFINQRELPAMYAAADALVHPAERDPHPLAVNEAALMGLPVVVSDRVGSVGPTDTARPGQNAIVHPVGDIQALASAIERLAANPALVEEMGEASRRVAAETGMAATVSGFMTAVREVVRRTQRSPR